MSPADKTSSLDILRAALADISAEELLRIQDLIEQMGGVEAARELFENVETTEDEAEAA